MQYRLTRQATTAAFEAQQQSQPSSNRLDDPLLGSTTVVDSDSDGEFPASVHSDSDSDGDSTGEESGDDGNAEGGSDSSLENSDMFFDALSMKPITIVKLGASSRTGALGGSGSGNAYNRNSARKSLGRSIFERYAPTRGIGLPSPVPFPVPEF